MSAVHLLFLCCLSLTQGLAPGKEGCVDVSRYDNVTFTTHQETHCTHKVDRTCIPREERVCATIPKTVCSLDLGYQCRNQLNTDRQRCDTSEEKPFTPHTCHPGPVKLLKEIKKMPVCEEVTKEVCDSKWIVNKYGEKVWGGNENCREKTWEDCKLVDREVTEEVETFICQAGSPISYLAPVLRDEEVTTKRTTCSAAGGMTCTVSQVQECTTVQWTECVERVNNNCDDVTVRMPQQTRNHLLRCTVDH